MRPARPAGSGEFWHCGGERHTASATALQIQPAADADVGRCFLGGPLCTIGCGLRRLHVTAAPGAAVVAAVLSVQASPSAI
jgi:hypothetical protein